MFQKWLSGFGANIAGVKTPCFIAPFSARDPPTGWVPRSCPCCRAVYETASDGYDAPGVPKSEDRPVDFKLGHHRATGRIELLPPAPTMPKMVSFTAERKWWARGLSQLRLQKCPQFQETLLFESRCLRDGPGCLRLRRHGGLRHGHFIELILWNRPGNDDHFLYGESNEHKQRREQHLKLGGERCDECCHHTGDIHLHIGERCDECEPDGDDHLHAHCNERRRLGHSHGNRDCDRGRQ